MAWDAGWPVIVGAGGHAQCSDAMQYRTVGSPYMEAVRDPVMLSSSSVSLVSSSSDELRVNARTQTPSTRPWGHPHQASTALTEHTHPAGPPAYTTTLRHTLESHSPMPNLSSTLSSSSSPFSSCHHESPTSAPARTDLLVERVSERSECSNSWTWPRQRSAIDAMLSRGCK